MYDQEKTQAPINQEAYDKFYAGQAAAPQGAQCGYSIEDILRQVFSYHPPTPETLPKFQAINQAAKNFAEIVLQNCPPSADRSDAIRKIREARMTANASIALNGLGL